MLIKRYLSTALSNRSSPVTAMNSIFDRRLSNLINSGQQRLLASGLKGLEKESLRTSLDGAIAQTEHPAVLGSALTHPHITTDYSEALLEFITPPFEENSATLRFLRDIHQFTHDSLIDEQLLATSMPCGFPSEESIPIAHYGSSNIGRMKEIYRHGLWHRYGRTMQTIAGVHFNYSIATELWPVWQAMAENSQPLDQFISASYFDLIRNIQRYGWLILYLFGASPAICKAFLKRRPEMAQPFDSFDQFTLFKPFATSLRMSDIGYRSSNQAALNISYNSLDQYVATLATAIRTPHPEYQAIGVKVDDTFRQLNCNILQIENEYYSSIRPKQLTDSGEMPTLALKRRGVHYVELRSLDVNIYDTTGVNRQTLCFIEALMLYALLQPSAESDWSEKKAIKANILATASEGRKPGLKLIRQDRTVGLKQWADEICDSMWGICEILDGDRDDHCYTEALKSQIEAINDADRTPSARMLAEMRNNQESFMRFAQRISRQHRQHFRSSTLDPAQTRAFQTMATDSLVRQQQIEAEPQQPFEQFLERYFSQN